VQEMPELWIVSDDLWSRVQKRQVRLKEEYAESGRKPVSRGASSPYLLSGFLLCGNCGARLIIVSGGGAWARYGCLQHWNRKARPNKITVRDSVVESDFCRELQSAVLAPSAVDYLTAKLLRAQQKQTAASDHEKRDRELQTEINRIVSAIATIGHSQALLDSL
jgi:site-specific DNA recombinase